MIDSQSGPFRSSCAKVDRVTSITRPVIVARADDDTVVIATKFGLALASRFDRHTWYRFTLAGSFWSVYVERPRREHQLPREAARLMRQILYPSSRRRRRADPASVAPPEEVLISPIVDASPE